MGEECASISNEQVAFSPSRGGSGAVWDDPRKQNASCFWDAAPSSKKNARCNASEVGSVRFCPCLPVQYLVPTTTTTTTMVDKELEWKQGIDKQMKTLQSDVKKVRDSLKKQPESRRRSARRRRRTAT